MQQNSTTSIRSVRLVVGVLILLAGLVWIGQGLGFIGGGFMSSDQRWAAIGAVLAVAGGYLAATSFRRRA